MSRIQEGHAHAFTRYNKLDWIHYAFLLYSVVDCKIHGYKSLTAHLPLELQHPKTFPWKIAQGKAFINFGEKLKKLFKIKLYWENAPLLDSKTFSMVHGQTDWTYIPFAIDLCLDTGHLILGASNKMFARARIRQVLKDRGTQIKHVHIHENDLKHDQHKKPWLNVKADSNDFVIVKVLFDEIVENRSYIIEN